jgi:hypothetical protein
MPRLSLDEVTEIVEALSIALTYAKQARHVAKKVHGDPKEVSGNLKIAWAEARKATQIMEMVPHWKDGE